MFWVCFPLLFLLVLQHPVASPVLAAGRASPFLLDRNTYGDLQGNAKDAITEITGSPFDSIRFIGLPSRDLPLFKEAPVFRNGAECAMKLSEMDIRCKKNESDGDCSGDGEMGLCDPSSVHIAMTLDMAYMRGSMAAILSIVQHTACPENVVFHFLASSSSPSSSSSSSSSPSSPITALADLIQSAFPYLRFRVYPFDPSLVSHRISPSIRQALEQPLNYARIYIADLLPRCIRRVIYLDSDIVVVDDIIKLWNTPLRIHTIAAPEYCHADFNKYFTRSFWTQPRLSSTFDSRPRSPCYFNTGVMVMDLHKWRLSGFTRRIEDWMDLQKASRIYELGSLPPFLLVFAGDIEPVEHRWNQHGLGGDNVEGKCRGLHEGPVSLLHWSGKGKPWDRLDAGKPCPLDSLWAPYDLLYSSSSRRSAYVM